MEELMRSGWAEQTHRLSDNLSGSNFKCLDYSYVPSAADKEAWQSGFVAGCGTIPGQEDTEKSEKA